MKMTKYTGLLLLFFLFTQCGEKGEDNNCEFDTQVMITHFVDNTIIPNYQDFNEKVNQLNNAAQEFTNNPNQDNLMQVRTDWKNAYLAYQSVAAFEFGPAIDNGFSFKERLNTFPANAPTIDLLITEGNTDINAQFKSSVGFPAIEYLLFAPTDVNEVLAAFTTADTGNNRLAYLTALTEDISSKSQLVYDAWVNDFRSTFINNTGSTDGSAMHVFINEYLRDYELLKNFKFKIPLGIFNGGSIEPDKAEGLYSGISIELATANLTNLINLYKGVGANGQNGDGLYDYLVCLKAGEEDGELLADAILDQFEVIQTQLNTLSDPLTDRLNDQKETVATLHTELQKNVPLLKREMVAAFGIKVSYQDADGD